MADGEIGEAVDDLANMKVGYNTVLENLAISAGQNASDYISAQDLPVVGRIGNSTFRSAGIKVLGSGIAVFALGNRRWTRAPLSGVMLDGLQDLRVAAQNYFQNGNSGSSKNPQLQGYVN